MHTETHPAPAQVARCRTTAEFLAALPWLVGESPSNCLLIIDFAASRAGVAARIALPREQTPGIASTLIETVLALLRRSGSSDRAPAIVIVTEQRFGPRAEPPFRALAEQLARRLRRAGWPPRELACLAADGWTGFLDRSSPRRKHPLAQLDEARSRLGLDPRDIPVDPGRFPSQRPSLAAAVALRCAALATGSPWPPASSETWPDETIELLETAEAPGFSPTPEWCARFAQAVSTPQGWFVFAMVAVSDRVLIDSIVETYGAAALAETRIERAERSSAVRSEPVSIWHLFQDITSTPQMRARLRALLPVLSDAAAQLPPEVRSGPLSLIAWFWWLCGLPSVAERRIAESLRLEPGHELTRLAERFLDIVPITEWAVRHSPERAAA